MILAKNNLKYLIETDPVPSAGGKRRLDRVGVGFAGANAYRMVDAVHEDLAVTDLSGFRGRDDCLDDLVHLIG